MILEEEGGPHYLYLIVKNTVLEYVQIKKASEKAVLFSGRSLMDSQKCQYVKSPGSQIWKQHTVIPYKQEVLYWFYVFCLSLNLSWQC